MSRAIASAAQIVAGNQRPETDIDLAGTTLDFIAFFPHFVNNN